MSEFTDQAAVRTGSEDVLAVLRCVHHIDASEGRDPAVYAGETVVLNHDRWILVCEAGGDEVWINADGDVYDDVVELVQDRA